MLKAARKELEEQLNSVDSSALAKHLGWKKKEVENLLASEPKVFSGDEQKNGENSAGSFFERLHGSTSSAPQLDAALQKERAALVGHCLKQLKTARQRLILVARYLEDVRLKELAVQFNCTEQAVHYQETVALKQMRTCLEGNGWQWDKDEDNV